LDVYQIYIASSTKKYEPTYYLKVAILSGDKKNRDRTVLEIARPFAEWFDEAGYFVAKPFQELLATNIPLVGRQDPKRIKSASQDLLDANPDLLDAVLAANAAGESTATPSAKSGASKRRKN
jgi:signal peptidase complex subunit 2